MWANQKRAIFFVCTAPTIALIIFSVKVYGHFLSIRNERSEAIQVGMANPLASIIPDFVDITINDHSFIQVARVPITLEVPSKQSVLFVVIWFLYGALFTEVYLIATDIQLPRVGLE